MTALAQSDILAEYACLLGDAVDISSLSEAARRQLETRLLAAVFKRRWPLLMHWRQHSRARRQALQRKPAYAHSSASGAVGRTAANEDISAVSDLPPVLPILREEIALLRAFLASEMHAILFDDTP
jgi:hypothetical protein